MAELTPSERLQPCLLDRLTDEHPESTQESRDQRVISLRRFRHGVLRDLRWLLNTGSRTERDGLDEFGEAERSVLNYGIPDLCGMTASGISPGDVERRMLDAIRLFEPRILRESLAVKVVGLDPNSHNAISFEISGDLWAEPLPDQLYIKTELDLETGQFDVKETPGG